MSRKKIKQPHKRVEKSPDDRLQELKLKELVNRLARTNVELQKDKQLLENEASTVLEEILIGMKQLQDAVNDLGNRVVKLEELQGISK